MSKHDADADVIVIGSGAGGAAMAHALCRQGLQVLLLEAGPRYSPAHDYRLHTAHWETGHFPHKVALRGRQTFAPLQALSARWQHLRSWNQHTGPYNPGNERAAWGYHHVVGVGGSTLGFTGEAHRLHPQAMRMRERFAVAADWPLDYATLEPYYAQAERIMGVAGPGFGSGPNSGADAMRWRRAAHPLPAHELSYASKRLRDGCQSLGLRMVPNALAALSRPYDGRPGCNYCGNCTRGCPRSDKGSADVTFLRKAAASGRLRLLAGATATRILSGAADRVTGVEYTDHDGALQRARGRALVLACGAIETPRLLFNSDPRGDRQGLANDSGQVGRNLLETLSWSVTGVHPQPLQSYRGVPADGICWDHNAPDAIPGVIGGCRFNAGVWESDLVGPIGYAQRVAGGFGREHRKRMKAQFGRALTVGAIGESLPDPGSFVDLDPVARDEQGFAKARIHSHLGEGELQRLSFMAATARAILAAAGAGKPIEEFGTYDGFSSTHVMGTCRMSADAADGVVDADCRSHRWRNLLIADASIFASSGGGEAPALTISALALRAGERLAQAARRGEL